MGKLKKLDLDRAIALHKSGISIDRIAYNHLHVHPKTLINKLALFGYSPKNQSLKRKKNNTGKIQTKELIQLQKMLLLWNSLQFDNCKLLKDCDNRFSLKVSHRKFLNIFLDRHYFEYSDLTTLDLAVRFAVAELLGKIEIRIDFTDEQTKLYCASVFLPAGTNSVITNSSSINSVFPLLKSYLDSLCAFEKVGINSNC